MEPLDALVDLIVRTLDVPLGPLLHLPREATLAAIVFATVGLLTAIRRLCTDQDRLRRADADLARLRERLRAARRDGDRAAVERLDRAAWQVRRVKLAADLVVAAIAVAPLGLFGLWGVARLDYLPARPHQSYELRAYYRLSSVGRLTHLAPRPDVKVDSPPIQTIVVDEQRPDRGSARWSIRALRSADDVDLAVRHAGETAVHRLQVGGLRYSAPVVEHRRNSRLLETRVGLERFRFYGVDFARLGWRLPPWLAVYLAASAGLAPIVKRLARVA